VGFARRHRNDGEKQIRRYEGFKKYLTNVSRSQMLGLRNMKHERGFNAFWRSNLELRSASRPASGVLGSRKLGYLRGRVRGSPTQYESALAGSR
jgi:hypothetical protein